jgi:hypothetical protein
MVEMQSSILLCHLASRFLSANGYVAFNGGDPKNFTGEQSNLDVLSRISKGVATKQGIDLSQDRDEE